MYKLPERAYVNYRDNLVQSLAHLIVLACILETSETSLRARTSISIGLDNKVS